MKQFLQLVCGALVIGLLCLGISHLFSGHEKAKSGKKYMFIIGENTLILN